MASVAARTAEERLQGEFRTLLARFVIDETFGRDLRSFASRYRRYVTAVLEAHRTYGMDGILALSSDPYREYYRGCFTDRVQCQPSDRDAYETDRLALVKRWGLLSRDGATIPPSHRDALALIERWCERSVQATGNVPVDALLEPIQPFQVLPDPVGERVQDWIDPATGRAFEQFAPIVRVGAEAEWFPQHIAWADIEAAIIGAIRRQLAEEHERIIAAHSAAGWDTGDVRHALSDHADWLYRRLALRHSPQVIEAAIAADQARKAIPPAERVVPAAGTIYNATRDLAKRLDLTIPRAR